MSSEDFNLCHKHTLLELILTLRPRLDESENPAWSSSFWDQGDTVQILGLQHTLTLMRKLHVRRAFTLTITFECLKTEFCRRSAWSG